MAAAFISAFLDSDGFDSHRFNGNIHVTRLDGGDFVDDVKTFEDFSEHGVVIIEMRSSTDGHISLALFGAKDLTQAVLVEIQGLLVEDLTLDDIELAAAGGFLGIDSVALTCSAKGSFLVEMILGEFSGDGIADIFASVGILAALDHELVDDTVER